MKAEEFKNQNIIIGEQQKEYQNLPAYVQQDGVVTFCMSLTPDEIVKIRTASAVNLTFSNFGRPLYPIAIHTEEPTFPIDPRTKTSTRSVNWSTSEGFAVMPWKFKGFELDMLRLNRKIWISVFTYGQSLQPISPQI